MDSSLEYACKRLQELESLLLVDVPKTVWPAEVSIVFSQIEKPGHSRRTISTGCGWKKCRYRQLFRGSFAGQRHG